MAFKLILQKLDLGQYGTVGFEKDEKSGGLRAELPLKNGYYLSLVTNFDGSVGFYGHWEEETFEVGILNKDKKFTFFEEIYDEDYRIDGGIWGHLHTSEILEKIKIIEKL